jgi:hypothetical protein
MGERQSVVWCKREGKGVSECLRKKGQCDDVFVTDLGFDGDEGGRSRQSQSERGRASGENNGDKILSDKAATCIRPAMRSMRQSQG